MIYKQSPGSKILIVDDIHPFLMESLALYNLKCDYFPDISKEEAINLIEGYEGLIVRSKFRLTAEVFKVATNLKFIGRAGAGMDNIDLDEASKKNVICLNAPEGNRDAVGEHTLGMMLALACQFIKANSEVKHMIWDRPGNRGIEIKNRCVGIIGYGFMGQSFASKLESLGCRILAYDKYHTGFGNSLVKEASLDEIFAEADILSLHIPLTSETKGWVNADFFKKFRKKIIFLNTSRGEIVHTADLVAALKNGNVAGAGLDVLENEKFPLDQEVDSWFEALVAMPQVLLTPHVAGWTTESYKRISEVLSSKILDFYSLGSYDTGIIP